MTKGQIATILFALALLFGMYYGCDRKPPEQKALEQSRSLVVEATDVTSLEEDARSALSPSERGTLGTLQAELEQAITDSARVEVYKQLSSRWFAFGHPAIAGHYAQQVAEITNTEEAWSIAGTTYSIGLQRSEEEDVRSFCSNRAILAFENAISLNPDNPANEVNLALVYTENPPKENPMQGVQMLLSLNKEYPDNVYILNNLGRLAIRTGQYARALERLQRAQNLAPENPNTNCLLAEAYQGNGQEQEAEQFRQRCQELRSKPSS